MLINITHRNKKLSLRKLVTADVPVLLKWLTNPKILEFYEGRDQKFTPSLIRKRYISKIKLKDFWPGIIEQDHQPIGYLQFYAVNKEGLIEYELEYKPDTYALDLFIGESALWGKGIGSKVLDLVVKYIFDKRQGKRMVIDPHLNNLRAIRAYEKVGFKQVKILKKHELHEGVWMDCMLMVRENK